MMPNRKPNLDPVLEIKRDGYLVAGREWRDNLLEGYNLSVSKTKHLHANLLFTTCSGFSILRSICRHITYIDPNVINTSWRDLAVKLGYSDVDVKCINNLRGSIYDPAELVLCYYASTKEDATVGSIIEALLELGFMPAVHQTQNHIDNLLAEIETGKAEVIEAAVDIDEHETKNIIKAPNFKPYVPAIFDTLPVNESVCAVTNDSGYQSTREDEDVQRSNNSEDGEGQRPNNTEDGDGQRPNNNEDGEVQRSNHEPQTQSKQLKKYCKFVMLSFANDGHTIARNVAATLRATTNKKGLPIGVLMLSENNELLQSNPGQMITDLVSKMDFVIPILTEGYFSALKQPNTDARLLDERYIQFIYNIMVSKYIQNNCLNTQVRSIIPKHTIKEIFNKQEFIHNAIFNAWKSDDDVPTLATNIVKSRRSRIPHR